MNYPYILQNASQILLRGFLFPDQGRRTAMYFWLAGREIRAVKDG